MRAESEIARAGVDQDASKAKASSRRLGKDETHQTQPEPTPARGAALRLSAASSGAVLFKLRLSASEWRLALTAFAAKVGLFWLSEFVS